jgi:predicted nucleotidyltransferase
MEKKLLDLSKDIDERHVTTIGEVAKVAEELGVACIIVGAMARDLILHYVYGAPVRRGTNDIDFGIQLSSWGEFNRLKSALYEVGYSEDKQVQRLKDPRGRDVDIVPFGPLQDTDANIAFPPKGDFEMSVLGFQEALNNSISVVIQRAPRIEVQVVSPPGLAILKIIAWSDRARDERGKDALDLTYLLEAYERVSNISERAYEVAGLMESVDWNLTYASAFLLGEDAAAIAGEETARKLTAILTRALDTDNPGQLLSEMSVSRHAAKDAEYQLLSAFSRGFSI